MQPSPHMQNTKVHSLTIEPLEEGYHFACPECNSPLARRDEDSFVCPVDYVSYKKVDGIWRFLSPARAEHFQEFIEDYERIRHLEGRGSQDADYYRSLPFVDITGRWQEDWQIRSRSYKTFVEKILVPFEYHLNRPVRILDVGAGNGWLSNRLASRGHSLVAIDLLLNEEDGLGAWRYYTSKFLPIQAEFDHIPFLPGQFDLVVFNASFHYSTEYMATLQEGLDKLVPGGRIVILDTPVFHSAESGEKMVRQREKYFISRFGIPSNRLPIRNFLTTEELKQLAAAFGIRWTLLKPNYGLEWFVRKWGVRMKDRREPASFSIIIAHKT